LADLTGGAALAPPLDDRGRPVDPLLIVDLDVPSDPGLLRAARDAAEAAGRILVGVRTRDAPGAAWSGLLAAFDVTLSPDDATRFCVPAADPWTEAAALHAAAVAHPQAATVLAQVLRASEGLDVRRALDVESFAYSSLLGGGEFRAWLAARGSRPVPPPAAAPPVLLERTADRLRITLNRPARRNAYGRELRDALVDALRVAALDDGIGAVTLAGAGPVFCAGGDLDEFGTTPDLAIAHFVRTRGGAGELLHRIAGRTEARLHGACVGAGIELAAFAGRVLARAGTTVRLPEAGMGLIPGAGGTVSIPRRIGRWRTLYLAIAGRDLDAATAARWGLVDEIVARP
jgi:enoyl-CoA hydratase/carnithine racemase